MLRGLLAGTLFFISNLGFAQQSTTQFNQLNEENGLAQNFVYGIVKDKRGFIWISTGKGLTRFDGKDAKTYTTENGLTDNFITESYRAQDEKIIFGHFQGSITSYNGAYFETIIGDTLNSEIVSITESATGTMYAASRSRGLIVWDDPDNPQLLFPAELQGKIVNQIKVAGTQLITATSEGIYTFQINGQQLVFNDAPDELLYEEITTLETYHKDSSYMWAATSNGLYLIRTGTFTRVVNHLYVDLLGGMDVRAIVHHNNQSLWIGTHQRGLFHFTLENDTLVTHIDQFNERNGFPIFSVNTLYVEANGTPWIGTLSNGIVKLYEPFFKYHRTPSVVTQVNATEEWNDLYLVATDKGLYQFDPAQHEESKQYQRVPEFKDQPILSIKTIEDELWVGTQHQGVLIYNLRTNKINKLGSDNWNQLGLRARLFEVDRNGNIWISIMESGVILVNRQGELLNHLSTNNGFIHNDIYAICPAENGEVWFGSLGAGLARMDNKGEVQRLSQQGVFPSHDINDITEHDGAIWIATDGQGYYKYENDVFTNIGPAQESASPFIKSIAADANDRLWMTTRRSIGYLNLETGKSRYYDKSDGLLDKEDYASPILIDTKGNLLLPNEMGVSVFNTEKVGSTVVLNTYLTSIYISFSPYMPPAPSPQEIKRGMYPAVTLDHDQNHVTLNFKAIDTHFNGPVYYRYYLQNLESGWSPPSLNSSVTYTSLEPGKYAFHAQATNDLRTWADQPMTYSFVVSKPYWDTWWFYLLQATGIVALFGTTFLLIRNPAAKRSLGRIMVFMCIFIVFDYLQNWLEPVTPEFIGSVPLYKTLLNLSLALILFPVERGIKNFFKKQERVRKLPQ